MSCVFLQLFLVCFIGIGLTSVTAIGARLESPTRLELPPSINDERLRSSLRDKIIVFIGDSVTRYQYLNLAVFVERNRWPNAYDDDEELPGSVCVQPKYKDFNEFFFHTNSALNGNELCDCWRTKSYNYENRRYYNPDLNVSLVFIFLGQTLPQIRRDFSAYPFKRVCAFKSKTGAVSNASKSTDELTICSGRALQAAHPEAAFTDHGSVLYNVTTMFQPDIVLVNWGHHSPYEMPFRKGKWVYNSMKRAITTLNREMHNHTRFIWKATSPACHHEKSEKVIGQCNLTTETDSYPPKLIGSLLVYDQYMEMFDTHKLVTTLAHSVIELKNKPLTFNETANAQNLTFENAMPLFFDDIHMHCWVNTELNRALLAQLFFQTNIS